MLRHIIYIYTVTSTLAQTPDVPNGGGSCDPAQNGWDCSLGGVCNTSQVCQCDAWFTGPTCALLNLQAPDDDQGGSCGSGFASYYSWGGRALEGSDGKFHASISFLCRHASLSEWTSVSSSAHMVADSPAGRYTWGGEQCVGEICTPSIVPWSHNTVLLEDDDAGAQKYQIWHVGDSSADPSKWSPCFNFSEVGTPLALPRPAAAQRSPTQPSPGNAAYVATGPSLSGPWTKWDNNGQIGINFTGSWTNSLAGNPAPLVMPDGSINLYFTAVPCPPNSGAKASNCIAVASSPTWEGPFQMRAAQHPITYPESEDPSVFRDPRGNYHLLTNVNTCHQRCAQGVECGGHAWSRDGFLFSNLTIGAFGPYITFRNGSTWANAYVERPLVTQDATGRPIALYLGMGRKACECCCFCRCCVSPASIRQPAASSAPSPPNPHPTHTLTPIPLPLPPTHTQYAPFPPQMRTAATGLSFSAQGQRARPAAPPSPPHLPRPKASAFRMLGSA
jgi:hypothetical protein